MAAQAQRAEETRSRTAQRCPAQTIRHGHWTGRGNPRVHTCASMQSLGHKEGGKGRAFLALALTYCGTFSSSTSVLGALPHLSPPRGKHPLVIQLDPRSGAQKRPATRTAILHPVQRRMVMQGKLQPETLHRQGDALVAPAVRL